MPPDALCVDRVASPIGAIQLVFDDAGVLRALDFEDHEERMLSRLRLRYGAMGSANEGRAAGHHRSSRGLFCRRSGSAETDTLGDSGYAISTNGLDRADEDTAIADLYVWRTRRAPRQAKRATRR